jgi:hypothetical protein
MSIKSIIEEATNKIAFATDLKGRIYIDVADLQIIIPEISQKIIEEMVKFMRSGERAGSFAEGCDCSDCDKYEKEIIKNLTS